MTNRGPHFGVKKMVLFLKPQFVASLVREMLGIGRGQVKACTCKGQLPLAVCPVCFWTGLQV